MDKINAGLSWKSYQYDNPNHVNNMVDEGFSFLRIAINVADFTQETPSQAMIAKFMSGPDGMWPWDSPNFPEVSKRWWSAPENDKVYAAFKFCKAHNWLPIVCFLHSEEQESWLTRSPTEDKWDWMQKMAAEFATYIKLQFGFIRADMESWNEPNECQSAYTHANVTAHLSTGWRTVYPRAEIYGFASNLAEQKFLDDCLAIPTFVSAITTISPHILTDAEWNEDMIRGTYEKALAKGLSVAYLEVSPLGNMNNLYKLFKKDDKGVVIGSYCNKYALVLWIRNSLIGQNDGITITDALIYDFNNPNTFTSVNEEKMNWITAFNAAYCTKVVSTLPPSQPTYINDTDWSLVKSIGVAHAEEPYLLAAIGWHETHWGTIGAGPGGWYLGYGYYGDPVVAAKYKGLINQLNGAHGMIKTNFKFPVTLASMTDFAVNHWKSSVPPAWAASVYKIFTNIVVAAPPAVNPSPYNGETWLATNFQYKEFFCQGKQPPDELYPNVLALAVELQKLRDLFACKIFVESGWRTVAHNKAVGGASDSQHLTGKAADIIVEKVQAQYVGYWAARYTKCNGIGFGKVNTTHLDIRPLPFTPYKY